MNPEQTLQFFAQLKVAAQLGTCPTSNTKDVSQAIGQEIKSEPQPIIFSSSLRSFSLWKNCPDAPQHRHMKCKLCSPDSQLSPSLLAQERDNFLQIKMQTHLRSLRRNFKSKC